MVLRSRHAGSGLVQYSHEPGAASLLPCSVPPFADPLFFLRLFFSTSLGIPQVLSLAASLFPPACSNHVTCIAPCILAPIINSTTLLFPSNSIPVESCFDALVGKGPYPLPFPAAVDHKRTTSISPLSPITCVHFATFSGLLRHGFAKCPTLYYQLAPPVFRHLS